MLDPAANEERRRCEDCRWWDNSTQSALAEPDTTGACRVRAPTTDRVTGRAVWPITEDVDWCRRFAPAASDDEAADA